MIRPVTFAAVVCRILAALLIGGILGMERGMKNRPAGLRTYMLVCVGSCLIMMTNQYIYQLTGVGDPVRLGAQVVSGIGFLGAGTIVTTRRSHIRGLTTAAGLWAAAGVGLALGIGFYEAALVAGCAIFIILTLLHHLDTQMHRNTRQLEVYVELGSTLSLGAFIRHVRKLGLEITDVQHDKEELTGGDQRAFIATLRSPKRRNHLLLIEEIKKIEGIAHLEEL